MRLRTTRGCLCRHRDTLNDRKPTLIYDFETSWRHPLSVDGHTLTKSGPLNREGFVTHAVVGAFAKHPPYKLFRHIHQGVLLLNADFAQQTTGDVSIVG